MSPHRPWLALGLMASLAVALSSATISGLVGIPGSQADARSVAVWPDDVQHPTSRLLDEAGWQNLATVLIVTEETVAPLGRASRDCPQRGHGQRPSARLGAIQDCMRIPLAHVTAASMLNRQLLATLGKSLIDGPCASALRGLNLEVIAAGESSRDLQMNLWSYRTAGQLSVPLAALQTQAQRAEAMLAPVAWASVCRDTSWQAPDQPGTK